MDYSLQWFPTDTVFFVTILEVSIGFIAYFFLSKSQQLKQQFTDRYGKEATKTRWVVFERLLGVFFFGIIPLITLLVFFEKDASIYGLNFNHLLTSLYWITGLAPVLIILNYLNSKKEDNLAMYPQIRVKEWDKKLLFISASTWILYLLAYEFMFRGFLLFVSVDYLGVWPAIALNMGIYALVHVPKGSKEAIGALPLGLLLCIITLQIGQIWVAFIVHVVLALSNEWFSLKAHPEMKVV